MIWIIQPGTSDARHLCDRPFMLVVIMLAACPPDQVKRSAYEAGNQKNCMDQAGVPDCCPEHMIYDAYRKDLEQVLETESP